MPPAAVELTFTTALRTAAMSAVAARAWSARQPQHGADRQRRAKRIPGLAFHHLLGITELRPFRPGGHPANCCQPERPARDGAIFCTSVEEAVRGRDIITTVTARQGQATIITPDMVEPGMHINAVVVTAPARPNCTQMYCVAPPCLWNMPRRHVWGRYPANAFRLCGDGVVGGPSQRQAGPRQRHQVTVFDSVGFAGRFFLRFALHARYGLALGMERAWP